jgi:F420-0:gamma-glutamyl ligase-like protein
MWDDPIVREVRELRVELERQFGCDVRAIFADLRARQGALGARLTRRKREPKAATDLVATRNSARHASA